MKFNNTIRKKILKTRSNGLTQKDSALMAGITEDTLYKWLKKGREAKSGAYRKFYEDMEKAKSNFKAHHINLINKDKSWQSSAWMLERCFPEEFSKPEVQFNINNNKINNTQINIGVDEDLQSLFKKKIEEIKEDKTVEPVLIKNKEK
ncbi:MAG: hypothetical protein LBU40_04515 [Methanobrevibacter sp.]|jgi:transcriptional regulator with XRE-family HTH domain|nr:hypothetical protein [Methanobrevibacter sp.]